MSIVQRIKETIGLEEPPTKNTFECEDCGHTFESTREGDSYWMTCEECDSRDVGQVDEEAA